MVPDVKSYLTIYSIFFTFCRRSPRLPLLAEKNRILSCISRTSLSWYHTFIYIYLKTLKTAVYIPSVTDYWMSTKNWWNDSEWRKPKCPEKSLSECHFNPLNPELNPICYLLALLAQHFLHVNRIGVKSLTLRLLVSYIYIYIYGAPILDVSRSHTTTQHSR